MAQVVRLVSQEIKSNLIADNLVLWYRQVDGNTLELPYVQVF